jgi:hypothetical protein
VASSAPGGTVVSWGDNAAAAPPAGLAGVTAIAGGNSHSLALKGDGTVVGWGNDYWGQATPPANLTGVTAVAAGAAHSLALKGDGTVVAWGENYSGQTSLPADLSGVTAIAAGALHSLALKGDGTVVGWGRSVSGQTTPPAGLSGVTAIAAGVEHSLALKSNGTVVAWGGNNSEQTMIPPNLSGVTAIAAGNYFSLALKGDGTVVGWGSNIDGQTSPPQGLSGVVAIAASGNHSLALKGDGTVVGWGSNEAGESTPPVGLSRVVAIAAGGYHSLALVVGDTTAPIAVVSSPPAGASYTLGQSAVAGYTCADEAGGSGLASCTGEVDGTPVANGSALPTQGTGSHTLSVTATDHAGNTATTTRSYAVFSSFGTASGRVEGPPALNTAVKAGATVPVLFSLGGNYGLDIFSPAPTATPVSCTTLTGDPADAVTPTETTAASGLSYDPGTGQYNYRWKTNKAWAGQCWQLRLPFGPNAGSYAGAAVVFNFRFDK